MVVVCKSMMRTLIFPLLLFGSCVLFHSAVAAGGKSNKTIVFDDCHPEQGQFFCQSDTECISASQICDKTNDCSDGADEFPDCDKSCKGVRCEHECMPNPEGKGICFCPAGFRVSGVDKSKCDNINECQLYGTCSQLCVDTPGSFQCSCMEGFELQRNNTTRCTVKDEKAKIIFALKNSVNEITLSTGATNVIRQKPGQPVGVTFDAARELIYWTDVSDKLEALYRSKLDGSESKVIIDTGLVLAEGIAFDWVAGNIYFTDSNLTHIGVCDKDGNACTVLIREQMDKPREIVLHPSTGKMFWTDWGDVPAIVSAGMDGSTPLSIVTQNLQWPNGLAIDHGNSRIYWADAHSDTIETSNLDGDDRQIVRSKSIRHPFSMDVFGDTIYWSDWTLQQIQSCNKFTGNDHHIIYSAAREQINGVAVYHPAAQPQNIQNFCLNKGCSHICVLTPSKSSRCLCPIGMILKSNRKTCIDDPMKTKLFVAEGNTLEQMHFHSIGNSVLFGKRIDGLHTIGSIAYNPINKTFILFDTFRKQLFSYNSTTNKLETLLTRHLDSVKGIDIDAVARNLYWVDAGKQTVEVMSLETRARAVLYTDETDRPFDIIAVPQVRSLFVAIVGRGGGKILKLSMDGNELDVIVSIKDGEPTALAYHHELDHIFWCDGLKGTIEHVTLKGDARFLAAADIKHPFSIAINGNRLYWTERSSPILNSLFLNTDFRDSPIYIGHDRMNATFETSPTSNFFAYIGLIENDLSSLEPMIETHPCSPLKNDTKTNTLCSHICLISKKRGVGTCMCPDEMQLDIDGRTCIPLLDCRPGQFKCDDGACISLTSKCDKFNDCPNGEDERNCSSASDCRTSDFVCKSDKSCISGLWHCDGEKDCHDGSDEQNCPMKPCPNSGDFRCALGRCIPQSWRCDHVVDCPDADHSDEAGCNFTCAEGEFKCGSAGGHDCISNEWVCDGEDDCADGSDEHGTCFNDCAKNEFRCMNHRCIRQSMVCNGKDDCKDNSDESLCPLGAGILSSGFRSPSGSVLRGTTMTFNGSTTTMSPVLLPRSETSSCPSDKYWCLSGECVSFSKVCNGAADCADGSDEGNHCEDQSSICGMANECSHKCEKTPSGPVCSCPPGLRLSKENLKTCEDIDECKENGKVCDHYCINVKGSFKCTCHDEYVLKSDHVTCKAKGNPVLFVYSTSSQIYVTTQDMKLQRKISVPSSLSGMDVDSHRRIVYWSNARKGIIGRSLVDFNETQILIQNLTMPQAIAYDWVSNNMMVIDNLSEGREKKRKLVMKICSLSENVKKRRCALLYHIMGHEVTSMSVAPEENFVFWTVLSFNHHFHTRTGAIRRGSMDSSGVTTLVSDKVINPTGLAIDHVFKRVFWVDATTQTVEVVNFDGKQRAVIISSGVSMKVNSLAVFENWVMWSDDGKNIRCRTDMQTDCMRVKFQNATDARYLVLLQQSLQPTGQDPCKNSTCKFICTGKVKNFFSASDPIPYTCFCPEGFKGNNTLNTDCTPEKQESFNGSPRNSAVKPRVSNVDYDDDDDNTEDNDSALFPANTLNAIPISDESNSSSSVNQMVVTIVSIVLVVVAILAIGGFVYYQRNGQRKILVRPYVQSWVKYVNDPMQRWRGNRREPLTNEHAYDEVYAAESNHSNHTYANPVYEEIDGVDPRGSGGKKTELPRSQADSGIMTLMDGEPAGSYSDDDDDDNNDDMHNGHYVSYGQHEKLLDKEFV